MRIWTPKKRKLPPCNPHKKHLQTLSDARAHRNRFRFNPWAKLGSLLVPKPLRLGLGFPCCCGFGGPSSSCSDCVDGGPQWWKGIDSAGRANYVYDNSSDCTWGAGCGGSAGTVGITGDKFYATHITLGTNYTDSQPTNGSGQIITCSKTLALTTGAGPWVSMSPVASAHSIWGEMTPPESLVMTVSGFTNNGSYCLTCAAGNGDFEVVNVGGCHNVYGGGACEAQVCQLGSTERYVKATVSFSREAAGKLRAILTWAYWDSSMEGCQLYCSASDIVSIDDYSLNAGVFPLQGSAANPCNPLHPQLQCAGTISMSVPYA